ncbi:MAG: UDP-N-acetylmuramoyl-L-alanyl-D-glutamate--2,6-diaminopimelate ligase [Actinomycetota bacterium]|jgi:UDP-N-acetylmuramoyl-L-alanyl-D-glutamate--2,6-diaminopimelate ligase
MRLDRLLGDVDVLEVRGEPASVEITAIAHDTAAVRPDTLFCCLKGARADGHDFAPQAVDAGAVALVCERFVDVAVAQARVPDARAAMGPAAATLYGHPSTALRVVGVTGTNGKTTVSHLLGSIFDAHGWAAGVIGTLTGARTTPEAPALQEALARFRDEGRVAVAMEVSSHALVQHRVDGVRFAVAVFTNLSQDHLDYHADMDDYFAAKARLFEPHRSELAVVNIDDPWGRRLRDSVSVHVVPYSIDDAHRLELGPEGATFGWEGATIRLRLRGRFNVMNALAAATTARELGIGAADTAAGLEAVDSIPGRFETIEAGQPFTVVVDYAHTPDGLVQALTAARELTSGRVLVVFGAGGDRDHAKRPLMGVAATRLADLAVLTSDNPRTEDPMAIIADVRAGIDGDDKLVVEPDRAAAIRLAMVEAAPGDVVVIAGKGHETGQDIDGVVHPFDDHDVARAALQEARRS